jgi:hypothetical protein
VIVSLLVIGQVVLALALAFVGSFACGSLVMAGEDCVGLVAKRVEPNQNLTITLRDGEVVQGSYSTYGDSGLVLTTGAAIEKFVATGAIRSIEFRDETRPRVGFVVGGIAGALVADDDADDVEKLEAFWLGASIGVLLGLVAPIEVHYERLVTCD